MESEISLVNYEALDNSQVMYISVGVSNKSDLREAKWEYEQSIHDKLEQCVTKKIKEYDSKTVEEVDEVISTSGQLDQGYGWSQSLPLKNLQS